MVAEIDYIHTAVLDITTDGFRWWGFSAAIIGGPDAFKMTRQAMKGEPYSEQIGIWAAFGLLFFFMFLAIAGGSIPLSSRIPNFAQDTFGFKLVALMFWMCASGAGWMFNVARTPGKNIADTPKLMMLVVAFLGYFVTFMASIFSYSSPW